MASYVRTKVKWEIKLIEYEDGSVTTLIPDGMSTIEQLELSMKARHHNLIRIHDLASRLLDEAWRQGMLRDL